MTKSKKYFLTGALIFLIILVLIALDFSRKTVAPWQREKVEISNE